MNFIAPPAIEPVTGVFSGWSAWGRGLRDWNSM